MIETHLAVLRRRSTRAHTIAMIRISLYLCVSRIPVIHGRLLRLHLNATATNTTSTTTISCTSTTSAAVSGPATTTSTRHYSRYHLVVLGRSSGRVLVRLHEAEMNMELQKPSLLDVYLGKVNVVVLLSNQNGINQIVFLSKESLVSLHMIE